MKFIILLLILLKISFAVFSNLTPKIVGGRDAEENEFPYIVSIRRAELELILGQPYHICGGSILSSNKVLTVSHCLFDPFGNHLTQPGSYFVVAGFIRMWTDQDVAKTYFVTGIFSHPKFDKDTLNNDIAILKVAPDFIFDMPNIQPINIDMSREVAEGTICSVHGWGALLWDFPFYPDTLQTVDLRISNNDLCNKTYDGEITENQICAYEVNKDSCSGDSGGRLVCNGLVVGIVSFGYGCAEPEVPGVSTKISFYQDFVNNFDIFPSLSKASKFITCNVTTNLLIFSLMAFRVTSNKNI